MFRKCLHRYFQPNLLRELVQIFSRVWQKRLRTAGVDKDRTWALTLTRLLPGAGSLPLCQAPLRFPHVWNGNHNSTNASITPPSPGSHGDKRHHLHPGAQAKEVRVTPDSVPSHSTGRRKKAPGSKCTRHPSSRLSPAPSRSWRHPRGLTKAPHRSPGFHSGPVRGFSCQPGQRGTDKPQGPSDLYQPLLRTPAPPQFPHRPSPDHGRQAPHDPAPTRTPSHVPPHTLAPSIAHPGPRSCTCLCRDRWERGSAPASFREQILLLRGASLHYNVTPTTRRQRGLIYSSYSTGTTWHHIIYGFIYTVLP